MKPCLCKLETIRNEDEQVVAQIVWCSLHKNSDALLEALKAMLACLPSDDGKFLPFHYKHPLHLAREAIAKAEGK